MILIVSFLLFYFLLLFTSYFLELPFTLLSFQNGFLLFTFWNYFLLFFFLCLCPIPSVYSNQQSTAFATIVSEALFCLCRGTNIYNSFGV